MMAQATSLPVARAGLAQRIVLNTALLSAGNVAGLVAGAVTVAALARLLGVENFGRFAAATAFVTSFQVFSDFGLSIIGVREAAQRRSEAATIIANVAAMRLALGAAAMIVCVSAAFLAGYSGELLLAILVMSAMLLIGALDSFGLIFQVDLRNHVLLLAGLALSLTNLLAVVGVAYWHLGIVYLACTSLLAVGVRSLLLTLWARRYVPVRFACDAKLWRTFMLAALPIGLSGLSAPILARFDIILLSRLASPETVGLYNAAGRVVTLSTFVPQALVGSAFPVLSAAMLGDVALARRLYNSATKYLLLLALPLGTVAAIAGEPLLVIAFGRPYAAAAPLLSILIWSSAAVYVGITAGNLIVAAGRQRLSLALNAGAAVLNVALNILLIPRLGAAGAATAAVLTAVALCLASLYVANRIVGQSWGYLVHVAGRGLCAAAVLAAVLYVGLAVNVVVALALAGMAYILAVFATRTIELAEVRQLWVRAFLSLSS
jgi:O-antigen/teichoic acid export membrane protein